VGPGPLTRHRQRVREAWPRRQRVERTATVAPRPREIRAPVLLVHGAIDADTPPDHSRRVLAALAGPKRLILVPGAGHNESLRGEVWDEIERWLDGVLGQLAG